MVLEGVWYWREYGPGGGIVLEGVWSWREYGTGRGKHCLPATSFAGGKYLWRSARLNRKLEHFSK